ncbi:hypothetical protein PFISCL1PPCAC_12785 [Pristionchus fissidentatus]|uniref:Copper transport protein n=1 Tax=Pristionchus fissidentatus TaxID=1538716 RepID=A0AAV5VT03_9BILA|nr:hypothetical protein PFISCL1PPCAC_12785 [Pristionchus fissidentatus]
MMEMYFHFRTNEPILLWEWLPSDTTGYVFSCIAVALISLAYEGLRFARYRVQLNGGTQTSKSRSSKKDCWSDEAPEPNCCCKEESTEELVHKSEIRNFASLRSGAHIADSLLFFFQLYGSYTLMLVWMTYNVPIVASSAAGHILGYAIFGPLMTFEEEEKIGDCCA